jgi:hypothetical protein
MQKRKYIEMRRFDRETSRRKNTWDPESGLEYNTDMGFTEIKFR